MTIGFPATDPGNGVTYQVSDSAWATWSRWATEGSVHESTSPGAGSVTEAAATHLYEAKGIYQIDASVRWVGTYMYTGYTGSAPVGPVELTGSVSYPVREVRNLLRIAR